MSYSKTIRAQAGERHPAEVFAEMPDYLRGAVLLWVELSMVPAYSVQQDCASYGLTLDAKDEIGVFHIPHDAFKGAMLVAGYEPVDRVDLNWQFRIRRRHWRRTGGYTRFTLDRQRLDPREVALFDFVASYARMRALADLENCRHALGLGYLTKPIAADEDRAAFRWAARLGLVGERISLRAYAAVMGSYEGLGGRRSRPKS
jgi:hypothetical protein